MLDLAISRTLWWRLQYLAIDLSHLCDSRRVIVPQRHISVQIPFMSVAIWTATCLIWRIVHSHSRWQRKGQLHLQPRQRSIFRSSTSPKPTLQWLAAEVNGTLTIKIFKEWQYSTCVGGMERECKISRLRDSSANLGRLLIQQGMLLMWSNVNRANVLLCDRFTKNYPGRIH